MSREWVLLAPLAVGHLAIFVLLFNVVHALGMTERRMDRVKMVVLAFYGALTAGLIGVVIWSHETAWPWPLQAYAVVCLTAALVGFPAVTLVRALRREPPGIVEESATVDLTDNGGCEQFIGSGRHSWLLRIPGNESLRLRKREWRVELPTLPPAWDGLSLVQLTDLHFAPCYERRYFDAVVDEALGWEADLVVFTGDLIDHDDALDWIVPVLSRLKGRLATYAILGNHDYDHNPPEILRRLEAAGFTTLEGRWSDLWIEGQRLAVAGTSYPWGPVPELDAFAGADFRLLLSHSPDLLYRAGAAGIDLMLSGHNHGGQIRFPVLGPVFMPSIYSRRLDRGYFRSGRTTLHVSQGVSGKHPIRFGCVPEIGRFVLHPTRPAGPLHADARRGRMSRSAR